ncbi:MAG: Membrane-bound lytic murein transglycosylase D precursor [Syntrophorhabdus sp. PtaU1.Bin058]|nr:MAG: Membrane-bound lytic murein transglycosylase D precursor [Syntrophorhabdus sp. PtaU1.Bin058]
MRQYIPIVLALLVLAGCASNTHVATGNSQYTGDSIAAYSTNPPEQVRRVETGTPKKTMPVVKKDPESIKNEDYLYRKDTGVTNEDDDISVLLGYDYARDFDIPIVFNDAVKYNIRWFTEDKRKVFGNWLRRSKQYVPVIKEILRKNGMPEDLVYLAMIESGFNPKAYSTAKASGPWQFIYATGERYGLKVNYWIDERRDPEKSTVAAAKYLRDLFNQFGCWYLAAAGYNAGERRIEKAIEKHNTNDFWELVKYNTLPRETREYIPRLIAAAIIAKDPEKFGFESITYDQPVQFGEIKVPGGTPLSAVAKAASLDVASVKSYNPEIVRGITPPHLQLYTIKLPASLDEEEFAENLKTAMEGQRKIKSLITYRVKRKDTIAKIAKRYGVRSEDICLVNSYDDEMTVKPGMKIQIPRYTGPVRVKAEVAKGTARTRVASKSGAAKETAQSRHEKQKTYHVVKKGETLGSISDKYGIDVASLRSMNNLKNDRVYPNMKLKLAGYSQKKQTPKVKYHVVKKGETLGSISSKYGTDVASLKSLNRLKSNRISANMKLRIPQDEG